MLPIFRTGRVVLDQRASCNMVTPLLPSMPEAAVEVSVSHREALVVPEAAAQVRAIKEMVMPTRVVALVATAGVAVHPWEALEGVGL